MTRKGWHHRGHLPHCDCDGLIQHIVFRLHDSLPEHVMAQMDKSNAAERRAHADRALDRCFGEALLRDRANATVVVDALHCFRGIRYGLHAWCVMPNHVHVVATPFPEWDLGTIVRSWKAFAAASINRRLNRKGRLWAADYFDRFMRDDAHLAATIRYVEQNPVAANLCERPEDWEFSSACGKDRSLSDTHLPDAAQRRA